MSSDFVYSRWTRYGIDRLYVRSCDGAELGWYDLQSHELHPCGTDRAILHTAVMQWRQSTSHHRDTPPADELALQPRDLAINAPGMHVQAEAERLRAERIARLRDEAGFWWFVKKSLVGTTREERNWAVGAHGEREVGGQLAVLGPAWAILHSIEVGQRGADIDHLVIGPPGAFTINTKTHMGGNIFVAGDTFMVNGGRYPYIEKSRFEAKRAADLLSRAVGFRVPVTPLIVPLGFRRLVVKDAPRGVFVIAAGDITRWLTGYPMIFPPHIVPVIYEKARVSTTWLA